MISMYIKYKLSCFGFCPKNGNDFISDLTFHELQQLYCITVNPVYKAITNGQGWQSTILHPSFIFEKDKLPNRIITGFHLFIQHGYHSTF